MAKMNSFSIDDAFQESEEDKIRLYNSEASPLQLVLNEEEETNAVEVTGPQGVIMKSSSSTKKSILSTQPSKD